VRFRYNHIFLPEYVSTVLISLAVSALFMSLTAGGQRPRLWTNPHAPAATAVYLLVACGLLLLTWHARRRCGPVELQHDATGELTLRAGPRLVALGEVVTIQETFDRLFGRTVRALVLSDGRGEPATVHEALFHYDEFVAVLGRSTGVPVRRAAEFDAARAERSAKAWQERHALFPPALSVDDVARRFGWRMVCLLPVAGMDILLSGLTMLLLSRAGQMDLMVYSAPLSLAASGLIARYVSFYFFTSTVLNRPL
jgi:hypothetical protein